MERQLERRFIRATDVQIETRADGTPTRISGYAAVFNSLSEDLGNFVEVIRPGTFARSLRNNADVIANVNHNMEQPLGRVSKGTLTLREDNRGLYFSTAIPDTSYARDAVANIRNGNLIGCSFAFLTPEGGDSWREEPGQLVRELRDVDLKDVSPVTSPAYGATEVSLRCLDKVKELRSSQDEPQETPEPAEEPQSEEQPVEVQEEARQITPMATILRRQYEAEQLML